MFGSKVLGIGALSLALAASAVAANRVGPVSQYGQLQAGKNSSGKGQIYGSCKGVTSGNEVAVQGMSFFWSGTGEGAGADFWTDDIVTGLVEKQGIQLVRAPMSVDETGWAGSDHYFKNESYYQGVMDRVVQSAINNDIYVIIDFHSHCAEQNTDNAVKFFKRMAEKWGKYDNVIFEIYNEPKNGCSDTWFDLDGAKSYWSQKIKPYSNTVIAAIREYSDNLIVAGTPYFDQYPNAANSDGISDNNVAYSFHYYAGDDPYKHEISKQGSYAESAMNSGHSVFVTEWGNSAPSGDGGFNSSNSTEWYNWMKTHKLSGANWAVTNKSETASYFSGSAWNYSTSGEWVNTNVFAGLPKSYTACSGAAATSSSSVASSSSALPEGYTDYIDDFEDGDSLAYTGGVWYAYNDNESGASSSFGNSKNKDGYQVVLSGSASGNSSKYVAGLTKINLNQGSYEYDPFVALGVSLNADESAYDLTKCNTISYKYKGASHNFKAEDTAVKDYAYHYVNKRASSSWTEAEISWGALMQDSWGKTVTLDKSRIAKFTWEIKGSQPSLDYLYVDDVRCDGMAIKKVVVTPASSSSAKSSSSVASSSSSAPKVTTFTTTSKTTQSVVAGNAIEPIVYKYENVAKISVDGLPKGLTSNLDQDAKTFTISGTVNATLGTADYNYTVTVTGIDENKIATGTIKVTRAPKVTTFTTTSKTTQSVVAGNAIEPIVYKYENVAKISVDGLPKGLTSNLDQDAKTFTISGTVNATLGTADYNYTVTVTGIDENKIATGTIKVTAKPAESSSSSEPEISSSSIVTSSSSSSFVEPESSSSEAESSSSMVVSSSSVESSSSVVVMYEISGNMDQTVVIGESIEPVAISGITSYNRDSWNMHFLTIPQQATNGSITISGSVPIYLQAGAMEETFTINGEKVTFKLTLVKPESSSSSSRNDIGGSSSSVIPSSSSSVIPSSSSSVIPSSSSSVIPSVVEGSSSSSEAVISSSSSVVPESSSSVVPESSSSAVPESSSSSVFQSVVAGYANVFKMGFANNQLTLSMIHSSNVSVQVFDMMGNMVVSQRLAVSGNAVVPMNNLRQGNYMVRVIDGSAVRTARIAIK